MTTQITVRLDDDLVEFVDQLVRDGKEKSRASAVSRAIQRERRREAAERDARILADLRHPDDLDSLVDYTSRNPIVLDLD